MENNKFGAISDRELEQVAGGMNAWDDAVFYGTVMGHLMNAHVHAQRSGNTELAKQIEQWMTLCGERNYALVANGISGRLPKGVFDSTDKDAFDDLKLAERTIRDAGIE